MAPDRSVDIESVFRDSSRQVFATLVRLLGDFDLAEDVMQEAFAAALDRWPRDGIPEQPVAWLVSTGRFKAIDRLRRDVRLKAKSESLARRIEEIATANATKQQQAVEDDRLRLIFTCCHPAIDTNIQVPLTLREVCGLTTEEIASAFLTSTQTMAQRLVRGKANIRDAKIPIAMPQQEDLAERLDGVLAVIYLIFNEGYSASSGDSLTRVELTQEAIRLCRLLLELAPDAEVMGLLALMLLHESRREARTNEAGEIILLEDQDRTLWDQQLIGEGSELIERSLATRRFGAYTLQAAISAVHAEASLPEQTDWGQIVALYDLLKRIASSPVVELNRAVAIAMRDGPAAGLEIIDAILSRGELTGYALAHAARGELLRRLDRIDEAREAIEAAMELTNQRSERRFLASKLEMLSAE
ncbi:RNA polymerase sigma factor [Rosistilla ulvae]|uniref:RNA polymerase sigma factor n=1 Tax=Rosistilla ulvae TaxID=1930277 RepID=A0A517LZG3_9BACT|nr:RNA polymerase sigma factor [Rosistilla ulvae]QDS88012.1 RNA polymerase sigma factor [Rosistilla ulvae]